MDIQPTSLEILEAINNFAESTERRFEKIESDIGGMKADIGGMKATMVTKDYLSEKLDEKLGSLRGDLVLMMRKENMKLAALIDGMLKEKVISQATAKQILQMEPFPHLSV